MKILKLIAFNHSSTGLSNLASFFVEETEQPERLSVLKKTLGLDELFMIATCNRVEFVFVTNEDADEKFNRNFLHAFYPAWDEEKIDWALRQCLVFEGVDALKHLFHVASSLDSMVVGEREIITQVRKAYENAKAYKLTGDLLRIVMKHTVITAKEVFSDTQIADRPVSVVSLAYRMLKSMNVPLDAKFMILGSGQTNTVMANYLYKHGYRNFTIFNRTLENARALATELHAEALPLKDLPEWQGAFDVILSCTGAAEPVLTKKIYASLLKNNTDRKIIVDLAIPNDVEEGLADAFNIHLIKIEDLKAIAAENLEERKKEISAAESIINKNIIEFTHLHKVRKIELAMSEVPKKIREIRDVAMNEIFAKEIDSLDVDAREILEKVVLYMEKKYISVPMKIAKEVLVGSNK